MKLLVTLIFWSIFPINNGGFHVPGNQPATPSKQEQPRLILETSIHDERYEVDQGFPMLRWNLTLTYRNAGSKPLMLYKKSSLIYRSMISRSPKAAAKGRYLQDTSSHFISADDMRAAGFLYRSPEEDEFVILKPAESYTVQADYRVERLGRSKNNTGLPPGQYILQLRVATWYHMVEPAEYREKWRDKGYVWSQNITSEPMPFRLK